MSQNTSIKSVLDGDRFITTQDIEASGLTTWGAPYTGSFNCVIPAGTILVARYDQVEGAKGFGCIPADYQKLEKILVPEEDRQAKKYSGYYFVTSNADIGPKLKLLSRDSISISYDIIPWQDIRELISTSWILRPIFHVSLFLVMLLLLPFRSLLNLYKESKIIADVKKAAKR